MRFPPLRSAARQLGSFFYCETQVRVRSCTSDKSYIRNSVFHRAKVVVDFGAGYSRRRDRLRACSLSQKRDLRRAFSAIWSYLSRPCPTADPPVSYQGNSSFVLLPKPPPPTCVPATQVQQKMICFLFSFLVFLAREAFGK